LIVFLESWRPILELSCDDARRRNVSKHETVSEIVSHWLKHNCLILGRP
jgi:hypothetical protein